MNKQAKTIVLKIGSNVLTLGTGLPNKERIFNITEQIHKLKSEGHQVVLISSGAVAAGRSIIDLPSGMDTVSKRQVLASLGQISLMNIYNDSFSKHNDLCSQVLITKESFSTREHYLNIKNCLTALLKNNITPIINENDVVSVTELMFTDNDELSGLVATMLNADDLLILTNVDGIFTDHPKNPDAKLISDYRNEEIDLESAISQEKSEFGRGGMLTKANTALKIADKGTRVAIGNGNINNISFDLLNKNAGTYFTAENIGKNSAVKNWISSSGTFAKGNITINLGAEKALLNPQANSILPVGVIDIQGDFKKGDIITIYNESGQELAYGKVSYDAKTARNYMKQQNQPAIVHYNYLSLK